MKILLFAPPSETAASSSESYPLALGYMGAVLEKEGHEVEVFNSIHENWEKIKPNIIDIIKSKNPDIVGISSMTNNRGSAFELARLAKEISPKIKVILGGVHPTLMTKQILENFPLDFIVVGEGEETIVELVKAIKKKAKLSRIKKIKGIAFKHDGKVIVTAPRPFIKNLDHIPFPKHSYFKENIVKNKAAYLITSRGCPYRCKFCTSSVHWGRMMRQRSVKNVIKEIKLIKKEFPYVKKIYFNDDEFILNEKWVKNFCNSFLKEKINLEWDCIGRVNSINEEIVKLMKSAGCTKVNLGIESGSPKMLRLMDKKITKEQIIEAFEVCKKHGLAAGIFLMVGLPGEDKKTIKETIKLIKKINHGQLPLPGLYQVFPGNEIYELAKRQGFISDDYWLTKKPAPFYTYENSRRRLLFWALKIFFYHKLYRKELSSFLLPKIRAHLKPDKLRRTIRRYFC